MLFLHFAIGNFNGNPTFDRRLLNTQETTVEQTPSPDTTTEQTPSPETTTGQTPSPSQTPSMTTSLETTTEQTRSPSKAPSTSPTLKAVNCEVDEVKSALSCQVSCGNVTAVPSIEAQNGGKPCPEYQCKIGDGGCQKVDCALDETRSGSACKADCLPVAGIIGTEKANGGADCPSDHFCRRGEGECARNYVEITSESCEYFGFQTIENKNDCKLAYKYVTNNSTYIVTQGQGLSADLAQGCQWRWVWLWQKWELTFTEQPEATQACSETRRCYCLVETRTPTANPTMPPPTLRPTMPSLKMITFTMAISMKEAEVTKNKDMLRESIATKFSTTMSKVFITFKSKARRMLSTEGSILEVEINDVQQKDVQGHKELMKEDSFEADLAALIKQKTNIAVTISDVSPPAVSDMTSDSTPKDPPQDDYTDDGSSGGGEEGGIIGGILGGLCCCCCVGAAYYFCTKMGPQHVIGDVFETAGDAMSKQFEQAQMELGGKGLQELQKVIDAHSKDEVKESEV